LVPEAGREDELTSFRQQCSEGALEPRQLRRIAKDGRIIHVSAVVAGLVNDAGESYAIATTERALPS
jgi:two-component system, chemotaxis family, CheB/CheR fusion protein